MAALVGGGVAAFVRRREARGFGGRLSLERAPVIDRPRRGSVGKSDPDWAISTRIPSPEAKRVECVDAASWR